MLGKVLQMATVGIKPSVECVERLKPVAVLIAIPIHDRSIAPNVAIDARQTIRTLLPLTNSDRAEGFVPTSVLMVTHRRDAADHAGPRPAESKRNKGWHRYRPPPYNKARYRTDRMRL